MNIAPKLVALLAAGITPLPAAASASYDALIDAREVICEFQKSGVAPRRGGEPDMLLVVEGIDAGARDTRIVSSRSVGAKPVRVYPSDTGVHFVQDLSGSVIVTTVLACDAWKARRDGTRTCRRFPAVNAWHFDQSVHQNPDRAFVRLASSSYSGFCEPWNVE
ncbi:MAG: hypothetical protein HYY28_06120 [Betaproteobacteria bacterium]|nr:hypothetical protein [Betaproteobacteria bacterium]